MNAFTAEIAAELHQGEKSTRQAQNFICLAKLAHVSPKRIDALLLDSSRPWSLGGIAPLLAYLAAHRL